MGSLMSMIKNGYVKLQYGDETPKQTEIVELNSIAIVPSQNREASTPVNYNIQDNSNCTIVLGHHNSLVMSDHVFLSQNHPPQSGEELLNSCDESYELHAPSCLSALAGQSLSSAFDSQVYKHADDNQSRLLLRKYRSQTNHLHLLRDKGLYEELEKRVETIEFTEGDADLKVFMLVERSITHCYRKELKKSQNILRQALDLIPHSSPSAASFLTALCHLYLASLHRREGKLDLAKGYINIALQELESLPKCELRALAVYENGSILGLLAEANYTVRDGNGNGPKLAETAENDLRQSISICLDLQNLSEDDEDLYIIKPIFALCKIAITKLKCENTTERNSNITDVCIRDAWNCIKTVEEKYGQQIPQAAEIQLHIAKSDYYYRTGKYCKAQKCARRALKTAESLSMNLELSRIRHRLNAINSCLQRSDGKYAEFLSSFRT